MDILFQSLKSTEIRHLQKANVKYHIFLVYIKSNIIITEILKTFSKHFFTDKMLDYFFVVKYGEIFLSSQP